VVLVEPVDKVTAPLVVELVAIALALSGKTQVVIHRPNLD
jgi:hypothetical protein